MTHSSPASAYDPEQACKAEEDHVFFAALHARSLAWNAAGREDVSYGAPERSGDEIWTWVEGPYQCTMGHLYIRFYATSAYWGVHVIASIDRMNLGFAPTNLAHPDVTLFDRTDAATLASRVADWVEAELRKHELFPPRN